MHDLQIKIGKRKVGENMPTFIVAEMSANHLQKYDLAVKTIHAMKEAGADAVKLQTYTPGTITFDSDNKYFKLHQGTVWDGQKFYELYKTAYTPWEWHSKLQKVAHGLRMEFFSTPFDESAVDFLQTLKVPAYKIGSFEIVDIPLIEKVASCGKPIIISTGIAGFSDIKDAVLACRRQGNNQIILLICSSSYPSPLEEMNLKTLPDMASTFDCLVGLSDHTLGINVPIVSVALGAKLIEKHFILDKSLGGPDSSFSLEPKEFKEMVESVRNAEKALGKINYELTPKKKKNRELCPSIFVVENIKKGEKLTQKNIRSIRPGFGLPPKYFPDVLGKKVNKNIKKGEPLTWNLVNK